MSASVVVVDRGPEGMFPQKIVKMGVIYRITVLGSNNLGSIRFLMKPLDVASILKHVIVCFPIFFHVCQYTVVVEKWNEQ